LPPIKVSDNNNGND